MVHQGRDWGDGASHGSEGRGRQCERVGFELLRSLEYGLVELRMDPTHAGDQVDKVLTRMNSALLQFVP